MRIYRSKSSCADQSFVFLYGDMLFGMRMDVSLGEPEIYGVQLANVLLVTNQEVISLYVPMDKPSVVYGFHPLDL